MTITPLCWVLHSSCSCAELDFHICYFRVQPIDTQCHVIYCISTNTCHSISMLYILGGPWPFSVHLIRMTMQISMWSATYSKQFSWEKSTCNYHNSMRLQWLVAFGELAIQGQRSLKHWYDVSLLKYSQIEKSNNTKLRNCLKLPKRKHTNQKLVQDA